MKPHHLLSALLNAALALTLGSGCGNPSFLVTPVYPSSDLGEVTVQDPPKDAKGSGGKIAVIQLEGMILNARTGGLLGAQENGVNRFAESLKYAENDSDVKAVVIRINSPGGSVSASDALYEEVKRFKQRTHKPVVAAIQDVGASGAYYVACAADEIMCQPTSIVGSIGVIFESLNFSGSMRMLGISSDAIKSAKNKDAGSPFREMTPDERAIFQKMINDYYARFKNIVQSRPIQVPGDKTETAFDGRVFTGDDAVTYNLVSRTGQLPDALDRARELAHTPRAKAVMYKLSFSEQGSIYASAPTPPPTASTPTPMTVKLPGMSELPSGFYYLWQP